jgi:perosamine synthetase
MSGSDRSREVYDAAVAREFAFLKSTRALADLHARSIVLPGDRGLLVPVCELHADDQTLIRTLSRWRSEHQDAFPTRFEVTDAGTARWLRAGLLDVEDRLLFLVCDRHGHPIGHLGFAGALAGDRSMMIDNVVRGVPDADRGLMSIALTALLDWATEMFAPRDMHLLVFEDNPHAVRFYERLGFATSSRIPLARTEPRPGTVSYVPAQPGASTDRHFLKMTYEAPAQEPAPILTAGPSMSARETSYALDAVRHGWNDRHSDYLDAFSAAFAGYIGVKHALPTSSCTGALHLSLLALGIGPGDEVIVPDLTWVATANAVAYTGATPVFADIEPDSWCLDPEAFRAAITPRTKAVMPVHLYGHPAQMDAIAEIAGAHDLRIVEDAAPSIGAEVAGRRTGSFGDAAGFSFQGAKLLVTGEGGMLVTDSDEVYDRARYLWTMAHEGDFWIGETGVKYRMSNVQAAVGLGQLERVEQLVEAKRRIFGWYEEELGDTPGLTLNREARWARSIYWMTSVIVDPESGLDRDGLRAALRAAGIDTRPVFPAISRYPMWSPRQPAGPVADHIGSSAINLPSGVCLRRDEVARVCSEIRRALTPGPMSHRLPVLAAPGNGR